MSDETQPAPKSALEVIAHFLLMARPIDKLYASEQEAAAALIGRLVREGYRLQRKDDDRPARPWMAPDLFDPNCPTCVWLKQHRGGIARKWHYCGPEFSRGIHDSQIADEKEGS